MKRKNIIIFGCGKIGRSFYELIDHDTVNVIGVVDNDSKRWGNMAFDTDIKIISPSCIDDYSYDYVVVCSAFENTIFAQLQKMGIGDCLSGNITVDNYKDICAFLRGEALAVAIKNEIYERSYRTSMECNWRNVFWDTVKGYEWFNVQSLSLGRWAIGYAYAYVMARALNITKPINILECGLGQSTKIVNSYVKYYSKNGCRADIVEHDHKWAEFFNVEENLHEHVNIHIRDLITQEFEGYSCFQYSNFKTIVSNKKYGLISIDGPFGSDDISRVDIIDNIPDILEEDFVIMMDDYERAGEKKCMELIRKRLKENGIEFCEGMYTGEKDIGILASSGLGFLTTL